MLKSLAFFIGHTAVAIYVLVQVDTCKPAAVCYTPVGMCKRPKVGSTDTNIHLEGLYSAKGPSMGVGIVEKWVLSEQSLPSPCVMAEGWALNIPLPPGLACRLHVGWSGCPSYRVDSGCSGGQRMMGMPLPGSHQEPSQSSTGCHGPSWVPAGRGGRVSQSSEVGGCRALEQRRSVNFCLGPSHSYIPLLPRTFREGEYLTLRKRVPGWELN